MSIKVVFQRVEELRKLVSITSGPRSFGVQSRLTEAEHILKLLGPDTDTKESKREWVGLTDEDVAEIERWVEFKEEGSGRVPIGKLVAYIEQALKEKNT